MAADSIHFDRAAEYYDATRGFPPGVEAGAAALISRVGHLTPESRVIEIGVGTGRIALPVSRYVDSYFGVDLSAPMLTRLHEKQNSHPVYVAQADATRLPFPDGCFDVAVAAHIFHLIPDWVGALAELKRVLKPEGKLLHGFGPRAMAFEALMTAWRSVIPEAEKQMVGANYETQPDFLEDEGWIPLGTARQYRYTYQKSPQELVDQLAGRVWSRTWSLSDETLQAGISAVNTVLKALYANPSDPVTVEGDFNIRAYQPPSG